MRVGSDGEPGSLYTATPSPANPLPGVVLKAKGRPDYLRACSTGKSSCPRTNSLEVLQRKPQSNLDLETSRDTVDRGLPLLTSQVQPVLPTSAPPVSGHDCERL